VTTTAAEAGTRRYAGIYPADPAQVRHVRAAHAELLRGCPHADDAILGASVRHQFGAAQRLPRWR
jgi:hypothetical protein